jgi:GWxTD domain-containing protein
MTYSRAGLTTAAGTILSTIVLVSLLGGCGGSSQLDNLTASKTVAYAPGVPNFDMEAIAATRDGATGIDVYLGVPYFSFVFEPDSSGYTAPYELTIQLLTPDGESLKFQETWEDTLRVENNAQTHEFTPLAITKHLPIDPGQYLLRTVLRDANSEKQASRLQRVDVPDLTGVRAGLSPVRMESKERSRSFQPVVTLHIPSGLDSLRASADLYNVAAADRVNLTVTLLRFETDNTVADPPYWLTPMNSSLEYRGINYGEADTVAIKRRLLSNPSPQETLQYPLPALDPGVYRVTMSVEIKGLPDTTGTVTRQQSRDLSVKAPEFPQVASLNEVVDALTYIARKRELEKIRSYGNTDSMRRQFDAFWGERTDNKEEAANLLETYYSRVEEANLYFTTHKAGWKTDRGMLYIVLGAPIEIDYYVDSEVWYYSYSARDPRRVYVFERGLRYDRRGMLFENFVLQRRPYYQDIWQRVINRWRRGEPLM